jgi:hypothetical protein
MLPFSLHSHTLKVGVWNNPPLSYVQNNTVAGFLPTIFKEIARETILIIDL